MKKIIFITLLVISLTPALGVSVQAASESASASDSSTSTQTTQKLKERIQRIVEEKSDKIKGAIDQLSQQKRGFIGQVDRVTAESLTVSNIHGTEIIPIDETVTLLKKSEKISVDKIAVGDWLVVMGLIVDDTFEPKRILVSSQTIRPRNHVVSIGTIVDQNSKKITILSRKNENEKFIINSKTDYQDRTGESVNRNNFENDLQVIIVGYEDKSGKTATVIRSLVSLEAFQNNE